MRRRRRRRRGARARLERAGVALDPTARRDATARGVAAAGDGWPADRHMAGCDHRVRWQSSDGGSAHRRPLSGGRGGRRFTPADHCVHTTSRWDDRRGAEEWRCLWPRAACHTVHHAALARAACGGGLVLRYFLRRLLCDPHHWLRLAPCRHGEACATVATLLGAARRGRRGPKSQPALELDGSTVGLPTAAGRASRWLGSGDLSSFAAAVHRTLPLLLGTLPSLHTTDAHPTVGY